MKTKKILSLVLATVMMLSLATTSFAAEITSDGGTQDVTVTYGTSEGFTVKIPADFTITDRARAVAQVSASNVLIAHDSVLNVTISGHDYVDSWELLDQVEDSNTLTYAIGKTLDANDVKSGDVILSVASGAAYNTEVTQNLYFNVIDPVTKSGTYKDTLTFTVSVDENL